MSTDEYVRTVVSQYLQRANPDRTEWVQALARDLRTTFDDAENRFERALAGEAMK